MLTYVQIQLEHVTYQDIQDRRETVRTMWIHQSKDDHDVGIQKLHGDQKKLVIILKTVIENLVEEKLKTV